MAAVRGALAARHHTRLITSEEALLAAQERGELQVKPTRIVINCPVLRMQDGSALRGVR